MLRGRAAYQRPGLGRSFHVREHAQREYAGEGTKHRGLRGSHPARLGGFAGHGCRLPRNPMAWEGLAGELAAVLEGRGLCVQSCDSEPTGEPPAPVRLRRNVCYVVLAVCLNEQDEVLLIQEAKRECHGSWYLPAGRMEPGETIVEALQREVKEEAGLHCEPLTLLSVEERGPSWIRFVFLARPTGGVLKTSKEADAESLQAGWYPRTSLPTPLRAHDILHLMELAAQYCKQARHPLVLPQELPCRLVCQRLVATFTSVQTVWVLVGTVGMPHLPITACGFNPMEQRGGIKMAVLRLLQECLTLHHLAVETKGLLGLQHLGKDHTDGICLNVLVTVAFRNPGIQNEPPKVRGESFFWWKVMEEDLQSQLLQRLQESSVVPVNR
ncbi:8-oxo-dGDP phosphatase NUDT18 [Pteropus medius]|nr:8-oxo-dGDP phosphatase NUDT18 [Pteropus giganteus]